MGRPGRGTAVRGTADVDNGPDHPEDDVTRVDVPVTRPEPSGPVRIAGAELAGEATSELPVVKPASEEEGPADRLDGERDEGSAEEWEAPTAGAGGQATFDQPSVRVTDQPGEVGPDETAVHPVEPGQTATPAASTELPHWTEPPTGEVPEVLSAHLPVSVRKRGSFLRAGGKRTRTGSPTRWSSNRRCSAVNTRRSGRWTRTIASRSGVPGSSTSARSPRAPCRSPFLRRKPAHPPRPSPASPRRGPTSVRTRPAPTGRRPSKSVTWKPASGHLRARVGSTQARVDER